MISQNDIKKLASVFATKKDLLRCATKKDLLRFATKDDIKSLATKDELRNLENTLITKLDAIMGEIQDAREEATVSSYRQSIHSEQIERLEQKVFGKSFA